MEDINYEVRCPNHLEWCIVETLDEPDASYSIYATYGEAKKVLLSLLRRSREDYSIAVNEALRFKKEYVVKL